MDVLHAFGRAYPMDLNAMLEGLSGQGGTVDKEQVTTATKQLVTDEGGINGLLDKLKQGGLDDEVDSWVSTGDNKPVETERLRQAIGDEELGASSAKSGLDIQQLAPDARRLPAGDHRPAHAGRPAPGGGRGRHPRLHRRPRWRPPGRRKELRGDSRRSFHGGRFTGATGCGRFPQLMKGSAARVARRRAVHVWACSMDCGNSAQRGSRVNLAP